MKSLMSILFILLLFGCGETFERVCATEVSYDGAPVFSNLHPQKGDPIIPLVACQKGSPVLCPSDRYCVREEFLCAMKKEAGSCSFDVECISGVCDDCGACE